MDPVSLHCVQQRGSGATRFLLGHGLGGDQHQWDPIVELLSRSATVVTYDIAGSGHADPSVYSPQRHSSVLGFADDLAALCAAADLRGSVFVGHSMSGMAGALAEAADPGLFSAMVLIGTSACYIDDPATGYEGGFSAEAIEELLDAVQSDFSLWAAGFAPHVMQNSDRPECVREFTTSLLKYRPDLAVTVFTAAFTSDFRRFVSRVGARTLVLQAAVDPAVPRSAAQWLADHLPNARLQVLPVDGHFPHVVAPQLVVDAIEAFVAEAVP
jgi:sigma-B regulation protein RsbQ